MCDEIDEFVAVGVKAVMKTEDWLADTTPVTG